MKICVSCKQNLPIENFHKKSTSSDGLQSFCKECKNLRRQQRRKVTPDCKIKNKTYYLKSTYGLSQEDFNDIYTTQKGMCCICKTVISSEVGQTKKGKAHVDHDHLTGKVRGLLCTKCNTLLGMANDSIPILKEAVKYLERGQDDD